MPLVVRATPHGTLLAVWLASLATLGLSGPAAAAAASRLEIQEEPLSEPQSDSRIASGDLAFGHGDYRAALEDYERAATDSAPAIRGGALNRMGILYERALGVAQDYTLAFDYFRRAADLGNSYAQANVGDCYGYGLGVAKDPALALQWYRSAAQLNVPLAFNALGWIYLEGLGVPKSPHDALLWYERGADSGSPNAAYEIGWIYSNVEPVNFIDAMRWYRIAATHHHREAENNIGALYEGGLGVQQDSTQAARWYQLASDGGLARAQYQLALLYLSGQGVKRDAMRAGELMRAAAGGGDAQAQMWVKLHP